MSRKQQRPFSAAPSSRAMNQYLRQERFLRGRRGLSMFTRILGYLCLLFCLAYCILFFHFYNITPDVTLSIFRTYKELLLVLSLAGNILGIVTIVKSFIQYFRMRHSGLGFDKLLTLPLITGFSCWLTSAVFLAAMLLFITNFQK